MIANTNKLYDSMVKSKYFNRVLKAKNYPTSISFNYMNTGRWQVRLTKGTQYYYCEIWYGNEQLDIITLSTDFKPNFTVTQIRHHMDILIRHSGVVRR